MSVNGNWILHYSWGSTGNYGQAAVIFNGNGTFGGTLTGKWRQQNGTIMLTFDGGPAKYGGTINGSVGSGVMSTFSGLDGSWYVTAGGITGVIPEQAGGAQRQPAAADGTVPLRVTSDATVDSTAGRRMADASMEVPS